MIHTPAWKSYRNVATQTASPGQLVLMLYEGAIRFSERALAGFDCEDPLEFNQTINNNILRAQAIIHELDAALDLERGGPFASNLHALYVYLDRCLQESNVQKQASGLREVICRITVLRDAWAEMLQKQTAHQEQEKQEFAPMAVGEFA